MGYQALLFCPDEKTARTVTQVLSELEFSVESYTEAFAAVKKLMAEHFDAVVVDCDNEQNATLLFKSARNSASNQTSLAVAVVEGQAGVAKAFRIGANLVLTKPINVEQAKGTLRVARGLLRKGDPAKSAAAATTTTPQVAPSKGSTATEPASHAPTPAKPHPAASAPVPKQVPPAAKSAHAASATSAPVPAGQAPDSHEIDLQDDGTAPVKAAPSAPAFKGASASVTSSGAASAAAPARAASSPKAVQESSLKAIHESETVSAQTLDLDISSTRGSETSDPAPSFTFGGANLPTEATSEGSKKAFLGVAAVALIGGGLYFGWTQFHAKSTSPSSVVQQPVLTPAATQNTQAEKSQTTSSAAPTPSSSPAPSPGNARTATPPKPIVETVDTDETDDSPAVPEKGKAVAKNAAKSTSLASSPVTSAVTKPSSDSKSTSDSKPAAEGKPAAAPIMVKKGAAAPSSAKAGTVDAPDPSLLAMAASGSGGELPNLGTTSAPKPVLQTLNVSQGVSQGLLIKKVQPVYPATAMHMHVEGSVQLMATIGKNGNITAVKTISGEPQLAKAALDAVKQWKYKPYYLNGDPVEIQTQITVNFKLPR
jgi:protein TonB